MKRVFPDKLKLGDEIRVVSPSRSLKIISKETREVAQERFSKLGLTLSFGKYVEEMDDFASSSIESRIEDLHDAFADSKVKGVLTVIGGFNSNQLLDHIDWELIRNNPKPLCGFSDITALNNAILAKTGLVSYSGTHYSTFGMKKEFEYTLDYFRKCLMSEKEIEVHPSEQWTDDEWWLDQENRSPISNEGWTVINEGQASGAIVGGNLGTLNLLQGTEYMPRLEGAIVFIEDDHESQPHHFDRDLTSLTHQPGFDGVKAIVIGRFQKDSNMTNELLKQIVKSKRQLDSLPVLADVDFGHTSPMITFPVGGQASLNAKLESPTLKILAH